MENSLKILSAEMHNFKNITKKQVDINGKSMIIVGSNNKSKSSFIQAMTCAFIPTNTPSKAITDGEEKGESVTVIGGHLDGEPVKYTIEMYFSQANQKGRLVIFDKDGIKLPSPNRALEDIVGNVSFDIDKFLALAKTDSGKPSEPGVKKQIEMLKQFLSDDVKQELTKCDIERKELYDLRKDLNAEIKVLEGQMTHEFTDDELELYSYENRKDVDEAAVREKLTKVGEAIENWNRINNAIPIKKEEYKEAEEIANKSGVLKAKKDILTNCWESLREMGDNEYIDPISEMLLVIETDLIKSKEAFEKLKPLSEALQKGESWLEKYPEKPTTEVLLAELKKIQEHNAKCDEVIKIKNAFDVLKGKKEQSDKMSEQIKGIEAKKKKIFADNPLPVKGLTFDESQVLYQAPGAGSPLPFNEQQFPSSTIIGVGVKIAMAMNPNLKIIIIKDGSLLDKKMYHNLLKLVEKKGFQLFIEMVSWEERDLSVKFAEEEV